MKYQTTKKTRRDFLLETAGAFMAATTGFDVAKATSGGFEISETSKVETLFSYIERVVSGVEIFPWRLLCPDSFKLHRVATLTFDRYFEFYQFKKRVLKSKKEEIEECVQKIDQVSSRSKSLILIAIYIYDCAYHENSLLFSYRGTRRNYGYDFLEMVAAPEEAPPNSTYYRSIYRRYYPYRFPVCGHSWQLYRPITLIGSNLPNREIDESVWKRWASIFDRFRDVNETAFPKTALRYEDYLEKIDLDERFNFFDPLLHRDLKPYDIPPEILGKPTNSTFIVTNIRNWFWNRWLANIDRLLEQMQDILYMKLTAIMWATDDAALADDFLFRAEAYLNNESNTDQEKRDLIAAAREYWASIQSWVDPRIRNWGDLPKYDMLGINGSRLKDVATQLGNLESR